MKYALISIFVILVAGVLIWKEGSKKSAVIYTSKDGERTTEITEVKESAKFEIMDPKIIPAEAKSLHDQGRKFGSTGKYEMAIEKFRKAIAAAPKWAYPPYDLAYTLLLQGKSDEALVAYKQVDELEPEGFFTTKTAIWALEREFLGKIPSGTYVRYLNLEDIRDSRERGLKAKELWDGAPLFTPALKEYAIRSENQDEKLALIEKALQLDIDPETRGVLSLNKALALESIGKREEAMRILLGLSKDKSETLFTRTSASQLIKRLKR